MQPNPRQAHDRAYGPAVSLYRLITGAGVVLETFESDGDETAVRRGRDLAGRRMAAVRQPRLAQAIARAGFAVERQDDSGWLLVHAWVPTAADPPRESGPDLQD